MRLEIDVGYERALRDQLTSALDASADEVYEIDGLLDLGDLWDVAGLPGHDELRYPPYVAVTPPPAFCWVARARRVTSSPRSAPATSSSIIPTTRSPPGDGAVKQAVSDPVAQVDAKEAGEIAYMLANGSGKIRAAKTGGSRMRCEWRLLFLSAGEVGLAQHMLEANKKIRAGQEVRLVDIPADAGKDLGIFENLHSFGSAAMFSNTLIKISATYYGSAAIEFLQRIVQEESFTRLPMRIKVLRENFLAKNLPENSSGQVYRVCERFGLIAAAGELATDLGITGWPSGEAENAAANCLNVWLECRGGPGNLENVRILSQVKTFFEAHGESRFSHWQAEGSHTINRAGFRKTLNLETQYYVLPEVFRHEICAGWDFHTVSKLLLTEGWIESDNHGKPYRREYLPGIGRSRCYVFTNRIWE